MAWFATIVGAGVGIYNSNKKSREADKVNRNNMAGFNQYKGYTDRALAGGEGALNKQIELGTYKGDTYAGPNSYQTGTAGGYGDQAMNTMNRGFDMANANSGFGGNSRDLYGQFQGLSRDAQADRMGTANQYALDNSGSLVTAAMRDDRRNLEENTLTGIDLAAQGSGNMNSSRAGTAEAVANRAFNDRRSDVSAGIQDSLRTQSLNQQAQQFSDRSNALTNAGTANNQIQNAYNTGMNTANSGYGMGMNAGGALQGFEQNRMNDARRRFEEDRDFNMNAYANYKGGMLTQNGPQTSNEYRANNENAAMAGFGGAQAGYGFSGTPFGQKVGGYFS